MLENKIDDSYGYMGDNAFPFFEEIIIISDQKDIFFQKIINIDLNFIEVKIFTHPADALYHLLAQKENRISYSAFILCEYTLGDFDVALLISLLRLHPLGSLFPVTVITNTSHEENPAFWDLEKNNLKALGAFSFLERPLTSQNIIDTAQKALPYAAEEEQKNLKNIQAIENADNETKAQFIKTWKQRLINFEKSFVRFFYIPTSDSSFEEIFLIGKQKYYDRLFNQATSCFERSSDNKSPHKADSLIYLYAIEKERANPEHAKIYLTRALDAYVDDANWEKVTECTDIFSKEYPDKQSPIYPALQKHFNASNFAIVNNIIENVKPILPLADMTAFLTKLNGSAKFPPVIDNYLNNKELKKVIYESNYKETTLDGDAYRKQQEKEKTLQRLEKQRLARINGEEQIQVPRQVKNTEKIVFNEDRGFSLSPKNNNTLENPKDKNIKNNSTFDNTQDNNAKSNSTLKKNSSDKKTEISNSPASQFGTVSSTKVESIPTVMLDGGTGSFLGDIINMAKFTKNLYKKK